MKYLETGNGGIVLANTILRAHNLSFQNTIFYPEITIEEHQPTFITGASGCGKSTFFRLLNATVENSGGTILYRGTNIGDIDSLELRKKVLLVNQNVYLFDGTIQENFREFYGFRQKAAPSKDEIEYYLQVCCVPFLEGTDCSILSGGERQRIFTAIFLSFMQDIILLDEPTAALDEKTAQKLMKNIVMHCEKRKITMLAISHDIKLVKKFAQKHIMLENKKQ